MNLRAFTKSLLARWGLRVSTRPPNRFVAMREVLAGLRARGFSPDLIVDGGANTGQWIGLARPFFPEPPVHLVEPQPACLRALEHIARSDGNMIIHPLALTAPGSASVRLLGGGPAGGSTGAYVALPHEQGDDAQVCPAGTLDALLRTELTWARRVLLKLDLEGHEIEALRGGEAVLAATEVIVSEVQFYEIERDGRPLLRQLMSFLAEREFELYDFAMLADRPRDGRLRAGDVAFVRRTSPLARDTGWA
jgi:FkbM family methyltransferase